MESLKLMAADVWLYLTDVWSLNVVMFFVLALAVIQNTRTGIRLAKRMGTYKDQVLKSTVVEKLRDYLSVIISLFLFMMMIRIGSLKLDWGFVSPNLLAYPLIILQLFFSTLEFRSSLENSKKMEIDLPDIIENIPDKINDALNKKQGNDAE